jgi:pimeloyl-ACP methyl ester carboxylesterase
VRSLVCVAAQALRDEFPGARFALTPGAAHIPNHEQPEAFNRVVRELLAAVA